MLSDKQIAEMWLTTGDPLHQELGEAIKQIAHKAYAAGQRDERGVFEPVHRIYVASETRAQYDEFCARVVAANPVVSLSFTRVHDILDLRRISNQAVHFLGRWPGDFELRTHAESRYGIVIVDHL